MIQDLITWQGWLNDVWIWLTKTPAVLSWFLFMLGLAILLKPQRLWQKKSVASKESPIIREQSVSLLEQYTKDDKDNLGKRFFVRDYVWSFDNLRQTDSFMRMTVTIINAATFPILIEGVKANNRFLIEGQECSYPAEMEGRSRIPRGESVNISIKQHVSQEMMNLIFQMNMRKQTIKISLKSCNLVVRPDISGHQSDSVDISFTFDQEVPIELKRE